jgi:hypothetical protein
LFIVGYSNKIIIYEYRGVKEETIMSIYMQYICKNTKCGRIFLAKDVRGAIAPQT